MDDLDGWMARTEDRGREGTDVRGQMSEGQEQGTEDGGRKDRGQKSDVRGLEETEDGGRKTDGGGQRTGKT